MKNDGVFETEQNRNEKNIEEFKCPNCGANMEFNPELRKLWCEHCDSTMDVSFDSNVRERDFDDLTAHTWSDAGLKTVRCTNCGAVENLKRDQIATMCPFCSSPLVVEEKETGSLAPDSLIPFLLSREKGAELCKQWLKKRFFAPSKFKKSISVDSIRGVYYPIWTFDSMTDTAYVGRLGKTRVVTHTDSKGNTHTTTHIDYFHVSGTRRNFFDDIVVNASHLMSDAELEKIQPFPQNRYVVYSSEYLAGFFANVYTVSPYTAFQTAEERMKKIIRQQIINHYHADVVDYLNLSLTHTSKSFKYMLMPVYVTATKYKDKLYRQYVNGSTGKTTGKAPVSGGKVTLVSLLGAALLGGIVFLIKYFGGF